jgi:hypothetical protein
MPESKSNNGWGIYAIRKLVEYAGIALAVWQLGIPALNNYVEERIEAYEKEHKSSKSFRSLLSEETEIPADRIHIKFGEWYNQHNEFEELVQKVSPLLEEELSTIRPRLVIHPSGRAKWYHRDGEVYDASIGQDGHYWFYWDGEWWPCIN